MHWQRKGEEMIKKKITAIMLAFICILTACSSQETENPATPPSASVESGSDLATTNDLPVTDALPASGGSNAELLANEWTGVGGYYVLEASEIPESTLSVTVTGDDFYYIAISLKNGMEYRILHDDLSVLYTASGSILTRIAVSGDGLWIAEVDYSNDERVYFMRLISENGEIMRTIELSSEYFTNSYLKSALYSSGDLYLIFDNQLIVISEDGTLVCFIKLSESLYSAVLGNNGQVYVIISTDDGNDIFEIDISAGYLVYKLSTDPGIVYSGDDSSLLILETSAGLYGIHADGNSSPIVIWEECSLSLGDIYDLITLSDGRYYCLLSSGAYILKPASFSGAKVKTKLVIASIGSSTSLQASATRFNYSNDDYYVEVVDYTSSGNLTEDQAITKINTELIAGNYSDMISFSSLSPYTYISKGYLVDMREYFESDDKMGIDDIVIKNALESAGGIYYIGNVFFLETLVGLNSEFGDRYGWTLSEYLGIESSMPSGSETLYNTTKEQFLRQICARYIRTAIDWVNGSCYFDSDEFIEILEASNRINENPEDLNNMDYTDGTVRVGKGTLVAAASWVNTVWKLAYEESMAGNQLSFIGWPTADGSCGSDIYLYEPIGIVSQSLNTDGCWEFIKFLLTDVDESSDNGLPVYKPLLDAKIEDAKTDEDNSVQISDTDAERFYALLAAIENTAIYDETVLEIIEEEGESLFSGNKTADQVAKIIQARVSLYVSEQS